MEELQVVKNEVIKTIDSMEVANMIGKRHSDLMRDIRTYVKYLNKSKLASEDFFIEATYQDAKNQTRPCYLITKLGCEMCANKLQGQKGVEFTAKYVMKFNEMEQAVMLKVQDSYMIDDPIKRAQKWIEEEQERQQLKLTAEAQAKHIETLAPKAAFADAVAASPDCILIRELAKILKQNGAPVGEQRLKEKLRQYGYLVKSQLAPDYNMPTQKAMELDIFRIKETTINSSSGSVHVTKTVKVTQKGVQYFVDKYLTGKMILN
jgi:Rha family phage regulatory protein